MDLTVFLREADVEQIVEEGLVVAQSCSEVRSVRDRVEGRVEDPDGRMEELGSIGFQRDLLRERGGEREGRTWSTCSRSRLTT